MEQNFAELNSKEMSELLKKALVEQGMISSEFIDEIDHDKKKALEKARKDLQATCYAIDYKTKKLTVFDTYTDEVFASVDLPEANFKFNPDEFDVWGNNTPIIDLEEIQKEGDIPFKIDALYGLAVRDSKAYLYNEELEKQDLLALTNQFIFGGNSKNKNSNLPYDMYFSSDYNFLCLSNRDEGKVYIFDTYNNTFTGTLSVRLAGSHKTINIAIATNTSTLYITDSLTPNITIYDLLTKKLAKKNLGSGILGSICLTNDDELLYVTINKPEPNLKAFNVESFEEVKAFPPKGEFFSLGDAPCDLLTLSTDKKMLFSMTYINEPTPFTPVITVIDVEKKKAIKRFSIKDETKPINIAFKEINPVGKLNNKLLEEILVEKDLFSMNKLTNFKMSILKSLKDGVSLPKLKLIQVEEESEQNNLDVEQEDGEFKEKKADKENEKTTPKKTTYMLIPTTANKHIMELLLDAFWEENELNLSYSKETEQKLMDISDEVRKKLEYYDLEVVSLKNFYEECDLECIVERTIVLRMLRQEENLKRKETNNSPSNCVNCSAPMEEALECPECGFDSKKAEDITKIKKASLTPFANLQKGHLLLLDSDKGMLIEVNKDKMPIWHISKEEISALSITQAYRLYNKSTLLLDTEANTLIRVSSKGRVVWKYQPKDKNSLLNKPSGYSCLEDGTILLADTENHRVMEMDSEGNIVWQYGLKGAKGNDYNRLNQPTDFQKTYEETFLIADSGNNRILELERKLNLVTGSYDLKVLWEYSTKLNKPLSVFRELDGNTLILDAGNKRIIKVDKRSTLAWEYSTISSNEVNNISNPARFALKDTEILIIGDGKLIEVSLEDKTVLFSIKIANLSNKALEHKVTKKKPEKKNFTSIRDHKNEVIKRDDKEEKKTIGNKSSNIDDIKEKLALKEKEEEKKKPTTNKYMTKDEPTEVEDFNEKKEEKKKITTNRYMTKDENTEEELILEVEEEKKRVTTNRYMTKSENLEGEKIKLFQAMIEESKKAMAEKKDSLPTVKPYEKPKETSLPIILSNKVENPEETKAKQLEFFIEKIRKAMADRKQEVSYAEIEEKIKKEEISYDMFFENEEENSLIADLIDKSESSEEEKAIQLEFIKEKLRKEKEAKRDALIASIIAETSKQETLPYAVLSENAEVTPFPIVAIDKVTSQISLFNRKAELLWSHQEKEKPLYVELTPEKTLVVTSSSKVFELDMKTKKIIWEYPVEARSAVKLKTGNILIADEKEYRIIEVNRKNQIVWKYETDREPFHAIRLSTNNTLITHSMGHIVREVTPSGKVFWSFGQLDDDANDATHLAYPEYSTRLRNGNTLITDTGNSRIIEVSMRGQIVWSYSGDKVNSILSPVLATRLKDGHTYIINSNYKQILEVNEAKQMLWKLVLPSKRGIK